MKRRRDAGREYAEIWGEAVVANRKLRTLAPILGGACLALTLVLLRIHPAPEAPHRTTADFDLVRLRDGRETVRERWSLTLRFTFLDAIPSELVVYNPMGLLITYLQADRALVTEAPA